LSPLYTALARPDEGGREPGGSAQVDTKEEYRFSIDEGR